MIIVINDVNNVVAISLNPFIFDLPNGYRMIENVSMSVSLGDYFPG